MILERQGRNGGSVRLTVVSWGGLRVLSGARLYAEGHAVHAAVGKLTEALVAHEGHGVRHVGVVGVALRG